MRAQKGRITTQHRAAHEVSAPPATSNERSPGCTSGASSNSIARPQLSPFNRVLAKLPTLTESEKFPSHVSIQTKIAGCSAINSL
jgi:hypothetical protein